jgi:hypothetical protein
MVSDDEYLKGISFLHGTPEVKIMEIYSFWLCFSLKTSNGIVTSLQILYSSMTL